MEEQLLALVIQQLAWQLDTYQSTDTKAIGLLAFDGALGAFISTLHPMSHSLKWLFFAALLLSIVFCVASLWIRRVYTGPDVQALYQWRDWSDDQDGILAIIVNVDADVRRNRGPLARKALYWMIGALAMVLAVVILGVSFVSQ